MYEEHVYRYPRRITWPIELICGLLVLWAAIGVTRVGLLLLWLRWPIDQFIQQRVPGIEGLIRWTERTGPDQLSLQSFTIPLLWLLGALFAALILRNLFPTVRFSSRGLLVSFADDWVPLRWEGLRALRVTDSPDSKRFVVLVEATA